MIIAVLFAGCDSNDNNNYSESSTVGSSSSVAGGFEAADGIVGGQLFSKFWADEIGFSAALY